MFRPTGKGSGLRHKKPVESRGDGGKA